MSTCSSSELSDSYFDAKRRQTTANPVFLWCCWRFVYTRLLYVEQNTIWTSVSKTNIFRLCLHLLKHSLVSLTNFSVLLAHKMLISQWFVHQVLANSSLITSNHIHKVKLERPGSALKSEAAKPHLNSCWRL